MSIIFNQDWRIEIFFIPLKTKKSTETAASKLDGWLRDMNIITNHKWQLILSLCPYPKKFTQEANKNGTGTTTNPQIKKEICMNYTVLCISYKFLSFFARTNFQHVIVTYSSTRWDISDTESAKIDGLKQPP